jgi:hypothetical protein
VYAETRLTLADVEELQKRIAVLKDWVKPGGHEDHVVAGLTEEIESIRPNSPRKRRRIADLKKQLEERDGFRAERVRDLAVHEARLAELQR